MPSIGNQHFEDYAPQTAAKHAILGKYFRAYVTALSHTVDAFHYVDGFAGQGTYGEGHPGSALLALSALASQSRPASVTLVEADRQRFTLLEESVHERLAGLFEPWIVNAEFAGIAPMVWQRPIYHRFRRVATFAFIDPCGVSGVRLCDIGALLRLPYGECLIFWNYDGLNRWIGAVSAGSHSPEGLRDFFGDDATLQAALTVSRSVTDTARKEIELRDLYTANLRGKAGARFILPFRFQARGKLRTSHYLLHCSNSPLAFRIMKDVMMSTASEGADSGTFEFLDSAELGAQTSLFRPAIDAARQQILDELSIGARAVRVFAEEWVLRPDDFMCERQYKDLLLAMEAEGVIEVIDEKTGEVKPASRRMRRGKPTLASHLQVRTRSPAIDPRGL